MQMLLPRHIFANIYSVGSLVVTDRQRIKLISQAPTQRQVRAPSPTTNLLCFLFKKATDTGPEKDLKEKRENSTGEAQSSDVISTEIVGKPTCGDGDRRAPA
jgi:hypothetical protein